MKRMLEYIIPVQGLSLGKHQYVFEIGESFLQHFSELEVEHGYVTVDVTMVRESNLKDFTFRLHGELELPCDRCLDLFNCPVSGEFRLILKYGEAYDEISDEVVVIPAQESRIDLSQYFYEYINLMIPLQKMHPDDDQGNSTCNREMLDRLNEILRKEEDPRWDSLKNIELD
ncbi:MAG: DUF177 domain-containing protein [Bacteroidales bacterium]